MTNRLTTLLTDPSFTDWSAVGSSTGGLFTLTVVVACAAVGIGCRLPTLSVATA